MYIFIFVFGFKSKTTYKKKTKGVKASKHKKVRNKW